MVSQQSKAWVVQPRHRRAGRSGRAWGGLAWCGALGLWACSGDVPVAPPAPDLASLPALPEPASEQAIPRGPEEAIREVTLTFVGEVRGEIEPCGCPTLPYGGFLRRQRLLDQLRAGENLVHLDAGETLVKGLITVSLEERTERAQAVLGLSKSVGVQAWTPGPTDLLALGLDGLRGVLSGRLEGPPPISATWEDGNGALILPPVRVVEAHGVRLGIIGLSAEPTAPELGGAVKMRDPVEATRLALAQLPPELDLVVGLGSIADRDADRIAEEVPEVAVLLTTRGSAAEEPRQVELPRQGALIVESSDRGRYLTVIRARLGSDRSQPLVTHPTRQEWKTLRTARAQLQTLRELPERTSSSEPTERARTPERLAAAEDRVRSEEVRFAAEGRGRNLAFVSSVPLAENLDGESAIRRQIDATKDETRERAIVRASQPPEPRSSAFAASSACVGCHVSETARWAYSDHTRAWQSLVVRREDTNVECVGCHSTGFGQPGGFGELTRANVGRFKAVQCEACHGPMAGHPDDPSVVPHPVTEETCLRCHDPANSPDFEFETYLRRATCQGGAPEVMPAAP